MANDLVYLCSPRDCSDVRRRLKENDLVDRSRRTGPYDKEWLAIPIIPSAAQNKDVSPDRITHFNLPSSLSKSPQIRLKEKLDAIAAKIDIPTTWEIHGDLILFPHNSFPTVDWKSRMGTQILDIISEIFKINRIGTKRRIKPDEYRQPNVELIRGGETGGWVKHTDNKIIYCYDVTRCMFSRGNITEKLWIGSLDCSGETVVDLFAGIGYFTLPYLVHAGARVVHACEWNPDAVEALKRGLAENGVAERCTIHFGDCNKVAPVGIANRVNLGLLPSSEVGWRAACRCLDSRTGGWLHVHGNVNLLHRRVSKSDSDVSWKSIDDWLDFVVESLCSLFVEVRGCEWDVVGRNARKVKSYGPHILHVVADIQCKPKCE